MTHPENGASGFLVTTAAMVSGSVMHECQDSSTTTLILRDLASQLYYKSSGTRTALSFTHHYESNNISLRSSASQTSAHAQQSVSAHYGVKRGGSRLHLAMQDGANGHGGQGA